MSHFDRFPADAVHPNAAHLGGIDSLYQDVGGGILDIYLGHTQLQALHVAESTAAIIQTADTAARRAAAHNPRTALVIGAGACIDVPLRGIVETFEQTTVVEVDVDATEYKIARMPRRLQSKVQLVKADASGFVKPMAKLIDQAVQQSTWQQYSEVLERGIQEIKPAQAIPDLGKDYDFVCSHLVMSQLASTPFNYADSRAFDRYGQGLVAADSINTSASVSISLARLLQRFTEQTHLAHLDVLQRSVAASGVIHFADTLFHVEAGQHIPLTTAALEQGIEGRFDKLRSDRAWLWQPDPERSYMVSQSTLTPKTA